jgi:hypothetical protein
VIAKKRFILLLLVVGLLVTGCSWPWEKEEIFVPDIAPEETEPNVETIPGDTVPDATAPAGGGSVSLSYSNRVMVDLSDKMVALYFANPARSNQDVILQIVVGEEIIVQSGLIPAGCQVNSLALLPDVASKLHNGGYNGKFVLYYYDRQTGEKATVSTEIPIYIGVSK